MPVQRAGREAWQVDQVDGPAACWSSAVALMFRKGAVIAVKAIRSSPGRDFSRTWWGNGSSTGLLSPVWNDEM